MSEQEVANQYVELCKAGKYHACLETLFAPNAVSVEAFVPPGEDRTATGIAAIRAKNEAWAEMHTIHSAEVVGPYPHDNRFAVRFVFDVTNKRSGERTQLDEIGLFTVEAGKITREEFFYSRG